MQWDLVGKNVYAVTCNEHARPIGQRRKEGEKNPSLSLNRSIKQTIINKLLKVA